MSGNVRICVDGIPGSGKCRLVETLAETLGLEAITSKGVDNIETLGGCKTPDALALWLLWCRNRVQKSTGVSVGSAEMWECLYRCHFEEDSAHVCAQIVRDLVPTTPPTPTVRIVIDVPSLEAVPDQWYSSDAIADMEIALQSYVEKHDPIVFNPLETTVPELLAQVTERLASKGPVHVVPLARLL